MSFNRINPSGFAVGSKVSSSQFNQLDVDHSLALDKSVAGDTLSGIVVVNGQLQAAIAAAFQTTVAGGLQLNGGPNDWPTFGAPRTIARRVRFGPVNLAAGWSIVSASAYPQLLVGPGTSLVQAIVLPARTGWTLTSVNLQIAVPDPHAGGPPANFPGIEVLRTTGGTIGGSSTLTQANLSSGGAAFFTASTGSGWHAGGLIQQLSLTCNQNNVIDESAYDYCVCLFDEYGANSASGNLFLGAYAIYTAPNMAPT